MTEHLTIDDLLKRLKLDPEARKVLVSEIVAQLTKEYLTIEEVAKRLSLDKRTIKNKMAAGIFQKGVHYFSPDGISPRFKWSAVQAWLESNAPREQSGIPMRGGYELNTSMSDLWKNSDHN
jgi:hypothetical protein